MTKKKKRSAIAPNATPNTATSTTPVKPPHNLEEQVHQRAYALYEARGREDGRDIDDWLRAEAEITGIKANRTTA